MTTNEEKLKQIQKDLMEAGMELNQARKELATLEAQKKQAQSLLEKVPAYAELEALSPEIKAAKNAEAILKDRVGRLMVKTFQETGEKKIPGYGDVTEGWDYVFNHRQLVEEFLLKNPALATLFLELNNKKFESWLNSLSEEEMQVVGPVIRTPRLKARVSTKTVGA